MVLDAAGVIIESAGSARARAVSFLRRQPRGHLACRRGRGWCRTSIAGARCLAVTRARLAAAGGCAAGAPPGWELADLCLRLVEQGLRNVWTPFAEVVVAAHELLPLPTLDSERGRAWLARRARYIDDDPA
jgi:hypothetical protein